MNKKRRSKKYLYVEMTVLLIVVIAGVLLYYTTTVQRVATEQCFSILDDSRDQLSQMITYEMKIAGPSGGRSVPSDGPCVVIRSE